MESSARSFATERPIAQPASLWAGLRGALGAFSTPGARRVDTLQESHDRIVRVFGALDKRLAPEIKALARRYAIKDTGGWEIDLSQVQRWDSEGLAALVYALDLSEIAGVALTLLDPAPALRQTLEKAQLHRLFAIALSDERRSGS